MIRRMERVRSASDVGDQISPAVHASRNAALHGGRRSGPITSFDGRRAGAQLCCR